MNQCLKQEIDYHNITTFQGLNALRFIAALLVVIHHGETIRLKNGIENFANLGLFSNGGNAVTFFFVLSGFLITYLLLKEHGKKDSINVKHFYLKRVCRIWPLYFLLVIIGIVVLPCTFQLMNITYQMPYTLQQTWYYFVFFLPGLVTFYFGHHFLEPLWSIGVEEVFYLLWAPLFRFIKKNILILLFSLILLKVALELVDIYWVKNDLYHYLVTIFQFEAMAIGGLGAYFVYIQGKVLTQWTVFKTLVQIPLLAITILFLLFHTNINHPYWNFIFQTPIMSKLIINFLFLYLILCTAVIKHSIIKMKSSLLSFLGEISYGIYMYHMLIIFATIFFLKKYLVNMNTWSSSLIFYAIVIGMTIAVSIISKYCFENYFLHFKKRWTINQ